MTLPELLLLVAIINGYLLTVCMLQKDQSLTIGYVACIIATASICAGARH
jgi:hypothetical protein